MKISDKNIEIMGILNITPDSFSDGGKFTEIDKAILQTEKMIKNGADIIDIGGESSRPFSESVSLDEELNRIIPIVEKIKRDFDIKISIDTTKSEVAKISIKNGADIINDISALKKDSNMVDLVAKLNIPIILMHMKGTPKDMQKNPFYDDVITEIDSFFEERIAFAIDHGIKRQNIILDPGIGFGKRLEDNIRILKELNTFKRHELPILIGLSKKRFLGEITGEENPEKREIESVVANMFAVKNGASIIRVHDVENTVKALKIFDKLF